MVYMGIVVLLGKGACGLHGHVVYMGMWSTWICGLHGHVAYMGIWSTWTCGLRLHGHSRVSW